LAGTGGWLFSAAALAMPVALGFAVMARGLYDLRTAANRGLGWLTLAALVAGVDPLGVAGGGRLLRGNGGGRRAGPAAGVGAVALGRVGDVPQRGVNGVTLGRWDEPYQVLAELGQRVEATADADRLLADVVIQLEEGLGLADVAIADSQGHLLAGRDG